MKIILLLEIILKWKYHHKGLENFNKVGCFLFNLINKEYAKKIIVMLPNQTHPIHHHKIKSETFHILNGDLELTLNGKTKKLKPGDIIDIKKIHLINLKQEQKDVFWMKYQLQVLKAILIIKI